MTQTETDIEIIHSLMNKRNLIKAKVQRIIEYVNNFDANADLEQLVLRKTSLENCLQKFEDTHHQLLLLKAADVSTEQEAGQFEIEYYATVAKINKFLNNKQTRTPEQTNHKHNINLPSLKLPTFSGAFHEWLSFYDTFNNLVHKDERLTDCEKIHYLKFCLTGEALSSVESLAAVMGLYASTLIVYVTS